MYFNMFKRSEKVLDGIPMCSHPHLGEETRSFVLLRGDFNTESAWAGPGLEFSKILKSKF